MLSRRSFASCSPCAFRVTTTDESARAVPRARGRPEGSRGASRMVPRAMRDNIGSVTARPAPPSVAPYIVIGLIAFVPLMFLSAAAPGGGDWRLLEYPRHVTVFALVLGVMASTRTRLDRAALVPLGTVALSCLFSVATERGAYAELVFEASIKSLAPWLVGGLYAVLAALAIKRAREPRTNRLRAGLWLAGVGTIAIVITMKNESWLTLENLSQPGTFRDSSPWPDTKQITIVLAGCATALGTALALHSLRKPPSTLPRAIVR